MSFWNKLVSSLVKLKRSKPSRQAIPNWPDWEALLDTNRPLWEQAKKKARNGPQVLMATSVGGIVAAVIT